MMLSMSVTTKNIIANAGPAMVKTLMEAYIKLLHLKLHPIIVSYFILDGSRYMN